MNEGVVDVELVDWPVTCCSQGEDGANDSRFDDRAGRIVVVDVGVLREAANNPSGFVLFKVTVLLELVAVDPLPTDDVSSGRSRNELPGLVGCESVELGLHGGASVGVLKSGIDGHQDG